jgi:hypothetical protein
MESDAAKYAATAMDSDVVESAAATMESAAESVIATMESSAQADSSSNV